MTTKNKYLDLKKLPKNATEAHILPNLRYNLILVGKLCNAGLTVTFNDKKAIVKEPTGKILIRGWRDHENGSLRIAIADLENSEDERKN